MSTETKFTGRYFILSNVAFQGEDGGFVKVNTFEDAIKKARDENVNAFHFYTIGDRAEGDMYMFNSVTGYEVRAEDRQSVGVIMERASVHE